MFIKSFVCDENKCTGCSACFSSCPKQCISMNEDEFGFVHPLVDESKCVKCGKCKLVCPANNTSNQKYPVECYAIRNLNKHSRLKSTSGGTISLLVESFIEKDGVVYCSTYENGNLSIKRFDKENLKHNLDKIRGSKYIQTMVGDSFECVKNDLNNDKHVLFISTPCQVDGLLHFLGSQRNKLYTIDLVCHGVPSQKMFFEHLHNLGFNEKTIDSFTFRKNAKYHLTIIQNGKETYSKSLFYDVFLEAFMSNLSLRNCCFSCKYAIPQRVGDITIGDFWGLGSDSKFKIEDGLNLLLINNEKGKELFSLIEEFTESEKRNVKEAIEGNSQLRMCSKEHVNRSRFRKVYLTKGFIKAVKSSRRFRTKVRYLPIIRKIVLKRYE